MLIKTIKYNLIKCPECNAELKNSHLRCQRESVHCDCAGINCFTAYDHNNFYFIQRRIKNITVKLRIFENFSIEYDIMDIRKFKSTYFYHPIIPITTFLECPDEELSQKLHKILLLM